VPLKQVLRIVVAGNLVDLLANDPSMIAVNGILRLTTSINNVAQVQHKVAFGGFEFSCRPLPLSGGILVVTAA
jgi:hypothetical protein